MKEKLPKDPVNSRIRALVRNGFELDDDGKNFRKNDAGEYEIYFVDGDGKETVLMTLQPQGFISLAEALDTKYSFSKKAE